MQSYNYLSNRQLFFNTENGDEVRKKKIIFHNFATFQGAYNV